MHERHHLHLGLITIATLLLQLATPASAWAEGETPPEPTPAPEAAQVTGPTIAEVLEAAPEGAALVVLDASGEPQALATQVAAETVATSDPVWCRDGYLPADDPTGGTYCTPSQPDVTSLMNALAADQTTYAGAGTIYFTTDYGIDDVYLHGGDARLSALTGLALDGMGFTFTVPVEITGWAFDVGVADLVMDLSGYGTPAAGLRVEADGAIEVAEVSVTGSGGGAYLDNSDGSGGISVTSSTFSGNDATGLDARTSGDLLVQEVTASGNEYGAYLDASTGAGSIDVSLGDFSGNSSAGLTARTADGHIWMSSVTADGSSGPDAYGAGLTSTGGGAITVDASSFQNNAGKGMWVEASGSVFIHMANASGNGAHGAYIHNLGACAAVPLDVTIDGGTYQDNGGYGVLAVLGPGGALTIEGIPGWGGNGAGDFLEDLSPCPECEEKPEGKPYHVVNVPETGGPPVPLDCLDYAGTILILPDGSRATLNCPVSDQATLESVSQSGLPSELPAARSFVSGVHLAITKDGAPLPLILEGGYLTLAFPIPDELRGASLAVYYWDPTLMSGAGGWVELPPYALLPDGSPMPHRLHPDVTPDDQMRILGGVRLLGDTVKVSVNFPGIFILAAR